MTRFLCTLLGFVLLSGCDRRTDLAPADQSYVVRARIVELPQKDAYLQLHHAAIPEFKDRTGKVVGMKEMVMEFAGLTKEVEDNLSGFASGDGVEVSFEVRWNSDPRLLVTKLEKLPATAELGLTKKMEPE